MRYAYRPLINPGTSSDVVTARARATAGARDRVHSAQICLTDASAEPIDFPALVAAAGEYSAALEALAAADLDIAAADNAP